MILIACGTRPEWLKIKPLIKELQLRNLPFKTLFTGQHDMLKDNVFDFKISINEIENVDRLTTVMSSSMNGISQILKYNKDITHVLVQGDTTSALGVAIGAFHNKVNIIHLEAGLRTYNIDNPYPEEANRQIIARISSLNLCPTEQNVSNLRGEDKYVPTYVVGNTGLDNLIGYKNKCMFGDVILVTLHRRENHDIISQWFTEINELAKLYSNYQFILPIHPNPNVKKHAEILTNVNVVEPLSHDDLLNLLCRSRMVISDSGGLQEECSFLGKKMIVCRKTTERPEAVDITSFMCEDPKDLYSVFIKQNKNPKPSGRCPFGDGKASVKIVDIFEKIVYLHK